jgi:hypothetical protein
LTFYKKKHRSLSSDEEEIEPLEESLMAGLDPELQKLVQNRSKVDQAEPNKIDLKIQYVNENDVDEKYRTLLVKLMKPIKIRVMDVRRETIYQTRQLTSLFLD